MTTEVTRLISVDDHVIEPPDLWERRLPAKYREQGPRLVEQDGGEAWFYDGKKLDPVMMAFTSGSLGREERAAVNEFAPVRYADMAPACYDPKARVEAMDGDGIIASVLFPQVSRFCGQTFLEAPDKELALLCVKAFNDFILEEWCAPYPDRFIPQVIIPLWDPAAAAAEIARTAALGARAVAFSENPAALGLPSIHDKDGYWDPFLAACSDAEVVICTHVGSSSRLPVTSPDAPFIIPTTLMLGTLPSGALLDWMFSGKFEKYPGLKLCLSEGGIGWMPYLLEQAQHVYSFKPSFWQSMGIHVNLSDDTGSAVRELFAERIFGCFLPNRDKHGVRSLDEIGIDNVMIESDYPHADATWPDTRKFASTALGGLSEPELFKVVEGNARRVFRFGAEATNGAGSTRAKNGAARTAATEVDSELERMHRFG